MKRICVIGSFDEHDLGGQTIKTFNIYRELVGIYGYDKVETIDTSNAKRFIVHIFSILISALRKNDSIIVILAHKGIRVVAPLLACFNALFRKKIFYVVIGGWLPRLIENKTLLRKSLATLNGIFVETTIIANALKQFGFSNIYIMKNFKDISPVSLDSLHKTHTLPLRLCTFSRVNEKKGIGDAIYAIRKINEKYGAVVYSLDIYGQIESNSQVWFDNLIHNSPVYVRYVGKVNGSESVDVLKNYFALLFPTKYYTEGIPGTIIDAFFSGLPVISSKWESFSDVIIDGKTGIGYEFNNPDSLCDVLDDVYNNPDLINNIRINMLEQASNFSASNAIRVLLTKLG